MHPRYTIWFFRVCSFQRTMMGDTKIYPNPLFGGAQDQRSWCKALKTRSGFPLAAFSISTKFSLASPFQEQIFLKKDASLGRRPTAHTRSSCKLCTTLSIDRCTPHNRLIDLPEAIDRCTLGKYILQAAATGQWLDLGRWLCVVWQRT